jgi:glycosyltransferase involved in cell wall biosynthesis
MSGGPDVSVIIPYYNREKYIDEAVKSVLAQTLRPLEIIIVNDCSSESSRRYLDRYQSECKIIDLPVNVGLAGSRNAGIDAARGEFIAFLDDDDVWLPHKLEVQRKYMDNHPECAIVHSAVWLFFQDGREEHFKQFPPGALRLAQALTNGYWAIIPSVLARSEVVRGVGGFDVNFRECEDRDFIIRCCAEGYQVEGIEEPLIRVRRQDQEGLTKQRWRIYRADLRMCWKHRSHYLRAYGPRGILSFVLEKGQLPARKTRYLDDVMWFLLQFVRYRTKRGYVDPVLYNTSLKKSLPIAHAPIETALLAEEKFSPPATGDISVIIPYYNRAEYIGQAIQSVLAQTLKPLEIIIVNDCSNKASRSYLDRYADVCRIIDLPKNVGPAGSRNAGMRAARGQFIALLDDDDIWMPRKLELQRQYFEQHPECSALTCSMSAFYWNGEEHLISCFDAGPLTLAQALQDEHWVASSTLMMRTQTTRDLGGFDVRFRRCEDRDFMIRVCATGYRLESVREPLLRLRRAGHGCLSEQRWRALPANLRVVWKNRAHYYRAYGFRGLVNFVLIALHHASLATRYVDGTVRLLLRMWGKNKWMIRPGYREPVEPRSQELPETVKRPSVAAAARGDEIAGRAKPLRPILSGEQGRPKAVWQGPARKANVAGDNSR